jgi:hypothetical protein
MDERVTRINRIAFFFKCFQPVFVVFLSFILSPCAVYHALFFNYSCSSKVLSFFFNGIID